MSPDRDPYDEDEELEEEEEYEEELPRSIFATAWFRALLAVILLAVVAVLALPYVLDWLAPPPKPPVAIVKPSPAPPATQPSPAPAPTVKPAPALQPAPAAKQAPAVTPSQPARPAPTPAAKQPVKTPPPAASPTRVAKKPSQPAPKPVAKTPAPQPSQGDYWVQVGAFGEGKNAARLVKRLSALQYSARQAAVTRERKRVGGNEVFVPGGSQREVYEKVKAKGYRVDAVKGGAAVRPLLSLRDAVALSKELAGAGMNVRIRRVGGQEKATFHLVRVGGFRDRRQADAARKELAGKGIPGFVVKGPPR